MMRMIKLCLCLHKVSCSHEKKLLVLLQVITYVLALRKCKNERKILRIILVQIFQLIPQIARFAVGFRLNHSFLSIVRDIYTYSRKVLQNYCSRGFVK